jgi:FkbM family methyltransferase
MRNPLKKVSKILCTYLCYKEYGRNANRDRYQDLKRILQLESPTIYDIGANKGDITNKLLRMYDAPKILAFEPIPNMIEELRERFKYTPNVEIQACALGKKRGDLTLNITKNLVSSSLLVPTKENVDYHGSSLEIVEKVKVNVMTLREFILKDKDVDIIKIDVQGAELDVLKGAKEALKRVKTISIEVEFVSMYEEQPLFGDIDVYLRKEGFFLYNMYEIWTHKDGQIESADVTYLNSRYFDVGQNY